MCEEGGRERSGNMEVTGGLLWAGGLRCCSCGGGMGAGGGLLPLPLALGGPAFAMDGPRLLSR